jgi:hypothetical protein
MDAGSHIVGALRSRSESVARLLVGIDGKDGSGKSRLADLLSERLRCPVVHLDDLLSGAGGGFVGRVNTTLLQRQLELRSSLLLAEGVCLLQVLESIGFKPDFLIYVKRTGIHGQWQDETDCDYPGTIQELIELRAREGMPPMPRLEAEVIAYHLAYRPHLQADHVYFRVED